MTNIKRISEIVAEQYATEFLNDSVGSELFLGSDIEQLLSEKAFVVYQIVDDSEYYGAAVHFFDKHFIAINTSQALRSRYYSAAHELWHLQYESGKIPLADIPEFDHERAADHFAAAVMLPKRSVEKLIQKLNETNDVLVIRIADISSMPYQAVVRRLQELGKRFPLAISQRTEGDWIRVREALGISPSVLDKPDRFVQFSSLSKEVAQLLKDKDITLEVAANLLKHTDPKQSKAYWKERQKLIGEMDFDDE
ncbi:MAG: ImmA/IrrE family metallo-endopeptidase [Trichococcus sp.]|uniref:ImmA/IrrE family metallo-endopeptidase n=1 Tax=Trichococcus sp. TaxID=1985464 RepID=UPI003C5D74EC